MRNICSAHLNLSSTIIIGEADCWVSIFVSFSSIELSGVPRPVVELLHTRRGACETAEQLPFPLSVSPTSVADLRSGPWMLLAHAFGTWGSLSNAARITVQMSRLQGHWLQGCLMKSIPDLCLKRGSEFPGGSWPIRGFTCKRDPTEPSLLSLGPPDGSWKRKSLDQRLSSLMSEHSRVWRSVVTCFW